MWDQRLIWINDGTLTIKGEKKDEREEKQKDYHLSERRYGSFQRPGDRFLGLAPRSFWMWCLRVPYRRTARVHSASLHHTQARSRVEGRAQDPGRSAYSSKAGTYPKLSNVMVATKRSIDMRHSPARSGKACVRPGHDLGVRPHIAKIIKAVIFPHQPRNPRRPASPRAEVASCRRTRPDPHDLSVKADHPPLDPLRRPSVRVLVHSGTIRLDSASSNRNSRRFTTAEHYQLVSRSLRGWNFYNPRGVPGGSAFGATNEGGSAAIPRGGSPGGSAFAATNEGVEGGGSPSEGVDS